MSIRDALNKAPTQDPFLAFLPVTGDTSTSPEYYGLMSVNGAWLIKEWNPATGDTRYVGGKSDFQTSWADRVNLTYTYPDGTS